MTTVNADSIKDIILKSNVSISRWAQDLGVTRQTIYSWVNAQKPIKIRNRHIKRIESIVKKERISDMPKTDISARVIDDLLNRNNKLESRIERLEQRQDNTPTLAPTNLTDSMDVLAQQIEQYKTDLPMSMISIQAMIDSVIPHIVVIDEKIYMINDSFTQSFGWAKEDVEGKQFKTSGVMTNGDLAIAIQNHNNPPEHNYDYHVNITHKDGHKIGVMVLPIRGLTSESLSDRRKISIGRLRIESEYWRCWGGFLLDESSKIPKTLNNFNGPLLEEHYGYDDDHRPDPTDFIHPDEIEDALKVREGNLQTMADNRLAEMVVKTKHKIKHRDGHYIESRVKVKSYYYNGDLRSEVFMMPLD